MPPQAGLMERGRLVDGEGVDRVALGDNNTGCIVGRTGGTRAVLTRKVSKIRRLSRTRRV